MSENKDSSKVLKSLDPMLEVIPGDYYINDDKNKNFVNDLYFLITKKIKPPYALSIDGNWGTGKTTLMKVLEAKLKADGYKTFWFNPWEYDQVEGIVFAFLQFIAYQNPNILKKIGSSSRNILPLLLRKGIDVVLAASTKGIITREALADLNDKKEYEEYNNAIEEIKIEFAELTKGIDPVNPVIIFFDDLDRCLPAKAIKLIESLKNLFVTKDSNAIFICGINTFIVKQFIKEYYKNISDDEAIKYFRKIFNLTIPIPLSMESTSIVTNYLTKLFKDVPEKHIGIGVVANEICRRCDAANLNSIREILNITANYYLFYQFNIIYYKNGSMTEKVINLIISMITLKEVWYPLYCDLINLSFNTYTDKSFTEIVNHIIEDNEINIRIDNHQKNYLKAYLQSEELVFKYLIDFSTLS